MRPLHLVALALSATLLAGCVQTHTTDLNLSTPSPRPAYNGPPIKGMAVSVADKRPKQDKIGTNWAVTDPRSTWNVVTTRPVAELVRDAVVAEFKGRGLKVGDGPARLQVDVYNVDSRAVWHLFRTQVYGSAMLTVQVIGPSGQSYLKKDYVDGAERWNEVFMGNQDEGKVQLEAVLGQMIATMAGDQAVAIALSKAAAETP